MKILNTTPHDIIVVRTSGDKVTLPKSEVSVRVNATTEKIRTEDGIEIYKERLEDPVLTGPSNLMNGVDALLVSRVAAEKMRDIPDYRKYKLYIPGKLIRDEAGVIIGCEGLIEV